MIAVGFSLLANRLRRDYYLLCSLAVLECLSAVVGLSPRLGGREGLPAPESWTVGGEGFELRMLWWTFGGLAIAVLLVRLILASAAGAAIDRIREHPEFAERWFPASQIRTAVVLMSSFVAFGLGILYLAYYGRVGPSVFSLSNALVILAFTALAGRIPELAVLAAFCYWVLPHAVATTLSLPSRASADLVQIAWGTLLLTKVVLPRLVRQRQRGDRLVSR